MDSDKARDIALPFEAQASAHLQTGRFVVRS